MIETRWKKNLNIFHCVNFAYVNQFFFNFPSFISNLSSTRFFLSSQEFRHNTHVCRAHRVAIALFGCCATVRHSLYTWYRTHFILKNMFLWRQIEADASRHFISNAMTFVSSLFRCDVFNLQVGGRQRHEGFTNSSHKNDTYIYKIYIFDCNQKCGQHKTLRFLFVPLHIKCMHAFWTLLWFFFCSRLVSHSFDFRSLTKR